MLYIYIYIYILHKHIGMTNVKKKEISLCCTKMLRKQMFLTFQDMLHTSFKIFEESGANAAPTA